MQRALGSDGILIIHSAPTATYSNDIHYRYRQNADFFFLTGLPEDRSILVLTGRDTILFLEDINPEETLWSGERLGLRRAMKQLKIKDTRSVESFREDLSDLLSGKRQLYYAFGADRDRDHSILSRLHNAILARRKSRHLPVEVVHPAKILHPLRRIHHPAEIEAVKSAILLTERAHQACIKESRPGKTEAELEATLLYHFHSQGGSEAYPSIVATGKNACVLHYIKNNVTIKKGELILIDAGASVDYFNADITRTFPADRTWSGEHRAAYEIVLEAQKKAIKTSQAGKTLDDVHRTACMVLIRGLMDLKCLVGLSESDHFKRKTYTAFYPHRTGHYLGLDVHDAGEYYDRNDKPVPLEEGVLTTVEPGLYFQDQILLPGASEEEKDKLKRYIRLPARLRGTGIRIEDNVLITGKGPLNLSWSIPKELADIEALKN